MNNIILVGGIPLSVAKLGAYDGYNKDNEIDFCIDRHDNDYTVDIYDATIQKKKEAFIKQVKAKNLEEAVDVAFNFKRQ